MKRISLKKVNENDWEILTSIRNEQDNRDASINSKVFSILGYKQYIKDQLQESRKNRHWSICLDGKIIGHAKIINQELGYIISKKFRNKGIGTKVIKKLFNEAAKLKFSKIYVIVKTDQPIALWFALKNGFHMINLKKDKKKIIAYKLLKKIKE
ncbi:MAG: GNAT family N-acetyltransferase [Nitrosopumilus sp.]|uniref:GNAT family N-acetyltransferase n=1 Tax=Nitrosopumilus sp. TaxID=2024843 RepID=UPI00247BA08B|nr:GNAT family N-acetyltransferase [Nitrosopumilus sp.]MCV0393552.1 GNAT family N-acetyltransferase [Nitrosopumilus sp.]